jgi:hypothetical protein
VANYFATDQSSAFVEASLGTNSKRIRRIRQRDGNDSTAVSSVSVAYRLRIQSEYVKGMEMNRLRYQAYRLRIGCVSTVRDGSTRQTDRLLSNDDRRLSSLEASNGPVATTVLLATTTEGIGSSTGFKGAVNE